ncbi:MAG TPA: hypothetical protein VGN37_20680 [Actinocatenispora sp.]
MVVLVLLGSAFVLAMVALVVAVVCGQLLIRGQRRLLEALRRNGIAFACAPTLGMQIMAGFVLAVDRDTVSLWKVTPRRSVRLQAFLRYGVKIAPSRVKVNVLRTAPALSLVSVAGERIDVVIYSDPGAISAPVKGIALQLVSDKIRESVAAPPILG